MKRLLSILILLALCGESYGQGTTTITNTLRLRNATTLTPGNITTTMHTSARMWIDDPTFAAASALTPSSMASLFNTINMNRTLTFGGVISSTGSYTTSISSPLGTFTNLVVIGTSTHGGNMTLTGNLFATGTVTGAIGNFATSVTSPLASFTTLTVSGATTLSGALTVSNTLAVTNTFTLGSVSGTTFVTSLTGPTGFVSATNGAITITSTPTLAGLTVTGITTLSGAVTISNTLAVTNTLTVLGSTTLSGPVSMSGTLFVVGATTLSGLATLSNGLNVTGSVTFTGALGIGATASTTANLRTLVSNSGWIGNIIVSTTGQTANALEVQSPALARVFSVSAVGQITGSGLTMRSDVPSTGLANRVATFGDSGNPRVDVFIVNPYLRVTGDGTVSGILTATLGLASAGSFSVGTVITTTNYTLTATDATVVSTTSGALTLTLPAATSITGRIYEVISSAGGQVTLTSASTISGSAVISTTGRARVHALGGGGYFIQ